MMEQRSNPLPPSRDPNEKRTKDEERQFSPQDDTIAAWVPLPVRDPSSLLSSRCSLLTPKYQVSSSRGWGKRNFIFHDLTVNAHVPKENLLETVLLHFGQRYFPSTSLGNGNSQINGLLFPFLKPARYQESRQLNYANLQVFLWNKNLQDSTCDVVRSEYCLSPRIQIQQEGAQKSLQDTPCLCISKELMHNGFSHREPSCLSDNVVTFSFPHVAKSKSQKQVCSCPFEWDPVLDIGYSGGRGQLASNSTNQMNSSYWYGNQLMSFSPLFHFHNHELSSNEKNGTDEQAHYGIVDSVMNLPMCLSLQGDLRYFNLKKLELRFKDETQGPSPSNDHFVLASCSLVNHPLLLRKAMKKKDLPHRKKEEWKDRCIYNLYDPNATEDSQTSSLGSGNTLFLHQGPVMLLHHLCETMKTQTHGRIQPPDPKKQNTEDYVLGTWKTTNGRWDRYYNAYDPTSSDSFDKQYIQHSGETHCSKQHILSYAGRNEPTNQPIYTFQPWTTHVSPCSLPCADADRATYRKSLAQMSWVGDLVHVQSTCTEKEYYVHPPFQRSLSQMVMLFLPNGLLQTHRDGKSLVDKLRDSNEDIQTIQAWFKASTGILLTADAYANVLQRIESTLCASEGLFRLLEDTLPSSCSSLTIPLCSLLPDGTFPDLMIKLRATNQEEAKDLKNKEKKFVDQCMKDFPDLIRAPPDWNFVERAWLFRKHHPLYESILHIGHPDRRDPQRFRVKQPTWTDAQDIPLLQKDLDVTLCLQHLREICPAESDLPKNSCNMVLTSLALKEDLVSTRGDAPGDVSHVIEREKDCGMPFVFSLSEQEMEDLRSKLPREHDAVTMDDNAREQLHQSISQIHMFMEERLDAYQRHYEQNQTVWHFGDLYLPYQYFCIFRRTKGGGSSVGANPFEYSYSVDDAWEKIGDAYFPRFRKRIIDAHNFSAMITRMLHESANSRVS
mmetsp:Transcript_26147/g.66388  ORF Transcript_26147/g.66388 Transcript_26147/m.66388 type:complete len:948 (-) Transcript_26147:1736-4579(-)